MPYNRGMTGKAPRSSAPPHDDEVRRSYDETPYHSGARKHTHPDRLAVLATLFGLRLQPVDNCRVLELGCGVGANLAAMACSLPASSFVGLDLSPRQIAQGQALVREAGLTNITLEAGDLRDLGARRGPFDYIIAHGLLSWVPSEVQRHLFEVVKENLAESGIAFVSYNTYPGWHLRAAVRGMLLHHARGVRDPDERVRYARTLINALPEALVRSDSAYAALLREERDNIGTLTDSHILHDLMSEQNTPFYFRDFIAQAGDHGLRFFAEAAFEGMVLDNFPAKSAELLANVDDMIEREQYIDFLLNRTLRESLLCHDRIPCDSSVDASRVRTLYVASALRPHGADHEFSRAEAASFETPEGTVIAVAGRVNKAALHHLLGCWPKPVAFGALLAAARSFAGAEEADDEDQLAQFLLTAFGRKFIQLHAHEPGFTTEISERPLASPWARRQAEDGPVVTNLLHDNVHLDDPACFHLLPLLDGRNDQAELGAYLAEMAARGQLGESGKNVDLDPDFILDLSLKKLAQIAIIKQ